MTYFSDDKIMTKFLHGPQQRWNNIHNTIITIAITLK